MRMGTQVHRDRLIPREMDYGGEGDNSLWCDIIGCPLGWTMSVKIHILVSIIRRSGETENGRRIKLIIKATPGRGKLLHIAHI